MVKQPRMLVLTAELKKLLDEHQALDKKINVERLALLPDQNIIATLKKQKLLIKDKMVGIANKLPPSQYASINPSLYFLPYRKLQKKLTSLNYDLQQFSRFVGPTSTRISKLKSEIRTVSMEIDRRDWERMIEGDNISKSAALAA
jgi:hypothetical protein